MNAALVLHEIRRRGVEVRAEGDRLRFRGPAGEIRPALVDLARRHKAALLALLTGENLVHIAGSVVHPDPESGPPNSEGGPGEWTKPVAITPGEDTGRDGEESTDSKSGPLGPPYIRNIPTRAKEIIPPAKEGFYPPEGGSQEVISCSTPPYLPERGPSGPSGPLTRVGVPDLSERWGPGLTDDTPGIVIPRDWSWEVANWPQPLWVEWRRTVTEYLDGLGRPAEADEIRAADHAAYRVLRPEPSTDLVTPAPAAEWTAPVYVPDKPGYPPGVEETGDTLQNALDMVENLKAMVLGDIDAVFGAAEAAKFPPHRWHELAKKWR